MANFLHNLRGSDLGELLRPDRFSGVVSNIHNGQERLNFTSGYHIAKLAGFSLDSDFSIVVLCNGEGSAFPVFKSALVWTSAENLAHERAAGRPQSPSS